MSDVDEPRSATAFPIVGVGASAGGLEAFTLLLRHLPADTGMAFVLVQHLDRTHPSLLSEALASATPMPVHQAAQGMRVEPNQVYVIAPNTDIAIRAGLLALTVRPSHGHKPHLPVDFFLRSLAAELGSHAIGMILSGSASDGTDGLRAIRAEDGITFAQDPRTAKFSGMPQSAIDAGVVDYCLSIPQLADELVRLSRHPYVQTSQPVEAVSDATVREAIFGCVREAIGIDFSEFKAATVARRLARRVLLRRANDLPAYLTLLKADPDEIRALYEDMLIHVTSFFRDPEMFASLQAHVFPEIAKHKPLGGSIRVWVAGCSTGEEVYSLAIALLEFSANAPVSHNIQIFGSDVSEIAIRKARTGVYGESALREVNPEWRARYFDQTDAGFRIHKHVRDLCVFVRHDLVRDPPFSKLDLVSCRNVLIYFDQALQKRVLPTLHYCLNQPGFLVLGRSENILGSSQLFSLVDKVNKVFLRNHTATSSLQFAPRADVVLPAGQRSSPGHLPLPQHGAVFAKHLDRLLLARYCPPGVLIDEHLDVLQFRGATGSYLQAAPGQPQNNLLSMARPGLAAVLRETIAQAMREDAVVRCNGVVVEQQGPSIVCDLVVAPFSGIPSNLERLFVVLFETPSLKPEPAALLDRRPAELDSAAALERLRSARLEHELAGTREYLQTLIEEHGRSNDELGTSNEELVSGNEELQSMNEELETAKEELQSINEELSTLNDELQRRTLEVTQVNNDLLNLALTVDIAILTLDLTGRLRRLTPKAQTVLNVQPADVGRPIESIALNIDVPDLKQQIAEVMANGSLRESEIQDKNQHWYRMQIRPYTAPNDSIDGVIISLVDIHVLKESNAQAQLARAEAERANTAKDQFLATLSHELRTPLSSMLLQAQLLRSGHMIDRAALQRTGDALERATMLQTKLIDDVLDVSRIVVGKLTLDSSAVDFCGVVRMALESLTPSIESKGLAVRLALDPAVAPIWGDRVRVHQVVANLLGNAIKFTPRGGQITLVVDSAAPFARLCVTDSGIGIDASFLPHVFARFSQSDSSITRGYGGLGLGLALVRHLVDMQGGSVQAESPGLGQGASFTVTFPLAPNQALDIATPQSHALDRPGRTQQYESLSDLRVLFVDDDLRTREAVVEVLHLTGARVQLAASVAEGLAALDTFKPQVILCDIAMPGEDGYSFVRKLRARGAARGGRTPALALTALASEEDRRRALAAGFQLHLSKPIDIDRLRDAVLQLSVLAKSPSVATQFD